MTTLWETVCEEAQNSLVWVTIGVVGGTAVSVTIDSRAFGSGPVERIVVVAILSLVTGLVFTLPIFGVRLVTGEELSELRPGGPLFGLIATAVLSGFVLLYLVLESGISPLILPLDEYPLSWLFSPWFCLHSPPPPSRRTTIAPT